MEKHPNLKLEESKIHQKDKEKSNAAKAKKYKIKYLMN